MVDFLWAKHFLKQFTFVNYFIFLVGEYYYYTHFTEVLTLYPCLFPLGSLDIKKRWCIYLDNCSSGDPSAFPFLNSPQLVSLQRRKKHASPKTREMLMSMGRDLLKWASLFPLDTERSALLVVSVEGHNFPALTSKAVFRRSPNSNP